MLHVCALKSLVHATLVGTDIGLENGSIAHKPKETAFILEPVRFQKS